jgi:16S rRNA (uracil1498-N3)-methyltransferase
VTERTPDGIGSERSPLGPASVAAAAMVFVDDPHQPVLSQADAHHLTAVLRLRDGEIVVAGDGAGRWVPCRVDTGSAPTGATLIPVGPVETTAALRPPVTVAFAPVKGDRPEWVVQKLTELGVDRIVPILTARSVVRWEGERATKAVERLRRVAREAAGQCRRAWLPEVAEICSLPALDALTGTATVLASPGGSPPDLGRPVVAVGPEGGWDQAELDAGFDTVGLGSTILRAETAAVVAGTLLCALRQHLIAPFG